MIIHINQPYVPERNLCSDRLQITNLTITLEIITMMNYCKTCKYCESRSHIHVQNLYYFCKLNCEIVDLDKSCWKYEAKKIKQLVN